MYQHARVAFVVSLCCTFTACGSDPSRDLTAPQPPEAGSLDDQNVSRLAPSNTWAAKSPTFIGRQTMPAGTLNGIIYVVGGLTPSTITRSVEAYNVATNAWSSRRQLPSARYNSNGASPLNGRLYVTGGVNSAGARTKTVFVYDPGTNTWMRKSDLPVPGAIGAQAVIGGELYVYTTQLSGHRFWRYDGATDSWVARQVPHTVHKQPAAGVIGGKFYLAGGFLVGGQPNLTLEAYNPATNSWVVRAAPPVPLDGPASGVLKGKLHVAGGINENGHPVATLRVYDPATNTWTTGAPMPTARWHAAGATASGQFFVISGLFGTTHEVEAYTP